MKKSSVIVSLLLAGSMLFSTSATPASAEDISGHWAVKELTYLIDQKIIEGYENGDIKPECEINRAEFTKMVVKYIENKKGPLPESKELPFSDVKSGNWYYSSISKAYSKGIIQGESRTMFSPNKKISRQDMATIISRALKEVLNVQLTVTGTPFKDYSDIAEYAALAVEELYSYGIIKGNPENTFAPKSNTKRAEAAAMIYRIDNPEKPTATTNPVTQTINVNIPFSTALDQQFNASTPPKADGQGLFTASKKALEYYLNPASFNADAPEYYQFLKLSGVVTGLSEETVNQKALAGKGILNNTAKSFMDAGKKWNVNYLYLIAHALHETGNGTSTLSKGVEVGLNKDGNPEMVTDANRKDLKDIKKVYNIYGIGAVDKGPVKYGSERAYKEGWFTVHDAIVGGAQFVGNNYINKGKDTLYKMKWNITTPGSGQYATHIEWAAINAKKIAKIYNDTEAYKYTNSVFEIPKYQNQPAKLAKIPTREEYYNINKGHDNANKTGIVANTGSSGLNIRSYPSVGTSIGKLADNTEITIIGENGGWYYVKTSNNIQGWVSGDYLYWKGVVNVDNLRFRSSPDFSKDDNIISTLNKGTPVIIMKKEKEWYQVKVEDKIGWLFAEFVDQK